MPEFNPDWSAPDRTPVDFIVVGAGAGGAPLAARLAERGYTVLVLEMGPGTPPARPPVAGQDGRPLDDTSIPLLHTEVSEAAPHALRYFVKHFDHDPGGSRDPLLHTPPTGSPAPHPADDHGVLYPRAQGVGGSTVHNAMITVCGPSEDWDAVADATGDASWRGERMRAYFERLEACHYNRPSWWGRILQALGFGSEWAGDRHGRGGWLHTTVADLGLLLHDRRLLHTVLDAAVGDPEASGLNDLLKSAFSARALPRLDPNNWRTMLAGGEGLARIPCSITPDGVRSGPRNRLLAAAADADHGGRLHLLTGVCVTGIEFAGADPAVVGGIESRTRAVGVRCLPRTSVYEADPAARAVADDWRKDEVTLYCRREVILCGGAFNTPQLLMLAGIGPAAHLAEHGIPIVCDLPGVGSNLQDRYEIPVVATVTGAFESLTGLAMTCRGPAAANDPHLKRWINTAGEPLARRGVYSTNGGLIALLRRSRQEASEPDLFIFAVAGQFHGYSVGYSRPAEFVGLDPAALKGLTLDQQDLEAAATPRRKVTWVILKGRTRKRDGTVRLRSASPFRRPEINFRSFTGGADDADLKALVDGVEFVRGFLDKAKEAGTIEGYERPEQNGFASLTDWVRNAAWGHHASGTCRIGDDGDRDAVLDSRFRVRGVQGLRVVDASAFPHIPGFFLATNIYMVSEKAADVLTEDHPRPADALSAACREALAAAPVLRSRAEFEARHAYPADLEAAEAELVCRRRAAAGVSQHGGNTP